MNKNILLTLVLALGVTLLGLVVFKVLFLGSESSPITTSATSMLDQSKYQAVFLANDQVYFGKVTKSAGDYLVMEDVYYLVTSGQQNVSPQIMNDLEESDVEGVTVSPEQEAESGFVLVRLGKEVHAPENKLVLNKEHVMFIEDLKADGKLVTAITESKKLDTGEPLPEGVEELPNSE